MTDIPNRERMQQLHQLYAQVVASPEFFNYAVQLGGRVTMMMAEESRNPNEYIAQEFRAQLRQDEKSPLASTVQDDLLLVALANSVAAALVNDGNGGKKSTAESAASMERWLHNLRAMVHLMHERGTPVELELDRTVN